MYKKITLITILLFNFFNVFGLDTSLVSNGSSEQDDTGWTAIKIGYGNETGGLGVAYEGRFNVPREFIGIWLGLGYFSTDFSDTLGVSAGVKIYLINFSEMVSLSISAGYGTLALTNTPFYGPFTMIGTTLINRNYRLLTDVAAGVGFIADFGSIFTFQASVGFLIDY